MAEKYTLRVNGTDHAVEADSDMPLLYALRDDLGMSNPHFGCGLSQCGACTVHVDGVAVMTAAAFLKTNKKPTDDQIRTALTGLKCRCGTHTAILRAVKSAAAKMA